MKIIVDSSCDTDEVLCQAEGLSLEYVPFSLLLDEKHVIDDESFEINAYIEKMRKAKSVKTAAPSPELYLEKMRGAVDSFVITISSPLSASHSNALLAKQMYEDEGGQGKIHVFDSLSASSGPMLMAMKINELIKNKLEFDDIVSSVTDFVDSMSTYFILEKYDNLVKNGRMNGYVAKVASMLNIKPVCAAVEGRTEMIDKAMGSSKALAKIIDKIKQDSVEFEKRILAVNHVRCLERANWAKDEIMKHINFKDAVVVETRGLCSTYADDGGIIISY